MHVTSVTEGLPEKDKAHLDDVASFSKWHLGEIRRRSGETYAEHCLEVAAALREASEDAVLLSVALLHDLPIHPDSKELLENAPLSEEGKALVLKMYELRRLHIDESTDDLDTVIDAFTEHPQLLLLRMAHRLNDVRNMQRFAPSLRKSIAAETLHMYSAIAGRLGMQSWRVELEDCSFPIVQPSIAAKLQKQFESYATLDRSCFEHTKEYLEKELGSRGIKAVVQTRLKGLYSTYRKMVLKNRNFEELTDRLAIRIITEKVEDCYLALGIVHAVMRPIPGKLKDYIGAPKENSYRSIHTVVYPLPGVTDQPIEIQIRTETMNRHCQYGPAAHADYKLSMYAISRKQARVNLFRNLQSLRQEVRTPKQFEEALRMYFREDHIAIFDTENNLYHFKKPATAMDFVCTVFEKKCQRLKEVRINGRVRPASTPLHDGDTVEAVFGRERSNKKEWLEACMHKSSRKVLKVER